MRTSQMFNKKLFPSERKLPEITNPVYINNLFHIWNRDEDIKETLMQNQQNVFITNKKEKTIYN